MNLLGIPSIRFGFDTPHDPPPANLLHCRQVHGADVIAVSPANESSLRELKADGLMTKNKKKAIGIQTADCLPVLFSSEKGDAIAAVHAGWRGLDKGILLKAVGLFEQVGVSARKLAVAIGPAIRPCCFEVGPEVIVQFEKNWGQLWQTHSRMPSPWTTIQPRSAKACRDQASARSEKSHWLDLIAIARGQLESQGLSSRQIHDSGFCTYCGPDHRASFRRSTHEGSKSARQWSWIEIC